MAQVLGGEAVGTFDLPSELFINKFAFGIDYGMSIIKLVYTTDEGDHLRVHIINFSRENWKEAFQFLKKISEGNLEAGETYHMCGVGIAAHLDELQQLLNIKCDISSEHMQMVDGFRSLSQLQDWEDFVYPSFPQARELADSYAKAFANLMLGPCPPAFFDPYIYSGDKKSVKTDKQGVQYPYILALVGSGHYLFKIDSETRGRFLDFHTIAGKTLMGLGSLLTGTEGYSEVLDLGTKGLPNELDQALNNLGAVDSDDVYGELNACGAKLFSFGLAAKGNNKDNHKKEDIAAALRTMITNTVAQDAFNWSMMENVHQVYFIGGVVANNEIIRQEIEQEFMFKNYCNTNGHNCECFFVKTGGHLSAIGTLLKNLKLSS